MPRIAVVITARASLARVYTVLEFLSGNSDVDLRIILAGGALLHHYGDTERDLPWPIAHRVYSSLAGNTLSTTAAETGILTTYLAAIFREEQPDCVVVIADRHETLAVSIAAAYQHIPLAHIQGGETTGSIDDKVRWANTSLADWHFAATAYAAECLERQHTYVTGCPSIDLAARAEPNDRYSDHIIVLQHPVTNEATEAAAQIDETFKAIATFYPRPILWFWPGQDAGSDLLAKRIREHREHDAFGHDIEYIRHIGATSFLSTLRSCAVLVGNSSVGIRECSYLGAPVVNIGTRQRGRERASNVLDVGYSAEAIAQAIHRQLDHGRYPSSTLYGDGHAGERIGRHLIRLCRDSDAERQQGVSREGATDVPQFNLA